MGIVVAATNRADVLDPALLRPGRFDRQVSVDVPDSKGRLEILKVHAKNKRVNPEISLAEIAKRVPGFSGADLANLMNEAAILCGRRNKDSITALVIDDSIDRIVAGMEGTKLTDGKVKSLVAYHEVGHAICGTLTPGHDPVEGHRRAPRAGQGPHLVHAGGGPHPGLQAADLRAHRGGARRARGRGRGLRGGRGDHGRLGGPAAGQQHGEADGHELRDVRDRALVPAGRGFSEPVHDHAHDVPEQHLGEAPGEIDDAVKKVSDEAYATALKQISDNREAMDKVVEILCEKETMSGDEFRAILAEYTVIPEENLEAARATVTIN